MPKMPATHDGGFIHSLSEQGSPVKGKFGSVTESQQFKRWFGDWQNNPETARKVVNDDGTPKVFYHGTSNYGFTVFEPYFSKFGLFGDGFYFTEDKAVAESYQDKGKGNQKGVYEVYLNARNPIDMEANADVKKWKKAFKNFDLDENYLDGAKSNEDAFKALKENLEDEMYTKSEARDLVRDLIESMGYDSVTHIGGGRYHSNDTNRHRVFIVFNSEQIKSATDNIGTFDGSNPDIRYSREMDTQKALERQVELLKGKVEYWKEQTRTRKNIGKKADADEVRKLGRKLLREYSSDTSLEEILPELRKYL